MATYPGPDIEKAARSCADGIVAGRISAVEEGSPAWEVGFEAGCLITAVDGQPVRDIIDWRWLTDGDAIELGYIDLDGEAGTVELYREEGESWGVDFADSLFDRVKLCKNNCIFCFMRQLPKESRASLVLRDDDFRLSFLQGTFVTLTNLTADDEARIVEQFISPLRVSLHASSEELRRKIIGRNAAHGLAALERLLAAGIQVHAQIVLMPGVNDREALAETLEWAWERPNILTVGIVPLGYTKFQERFDHSFERPQDALEVIRVIEPFQKRARAERGTPWVFAADEFYGTAFGADTAANIPPASDYGDFDMFEDGIGIIRSFVDDFAVARESGLMGKCAEVLRESGIRPVYLIGEAMQPFLDAMVAGSPLAGLLRILTVKNDFYGGNVTVTGLLTGTDMAAAIAADGESGPYLLPQVVFNHDGVTLDDMTASAIENAAGAAIAVVSCNPTEYLKEIIDVAAAHQSA